MMPLLRLAHTHMYVLIIKIPIKDFLEFNKMIVEGTVMTLGKNNKRHEL
jgi:hypothetical protein